MRGWGIRSYLSQRDKPPSSSLVAVEPEDRALEPGGEHDNSYFIGGAVISCRHPKLEETLVVWKSIAPARPRFPTHDDGSHIRPEARYVGSAQRGLSPRNLRLRLDVRTDILRRTRATYLSLCVRRK